ncbi:MAG: RodZ domain-containing protein [Pseudomonadota bacterium]
MINLDETPENKEVSPGKLLQQGRLQFGLTQDQVAKELYLTVAKVIALEADDFARVGPDTFVRGYIRAYANILKLDAAKIIAAYEQCTKEKSQLNANIATPVNVNSNKRMWKFVALIAATLIGLWLISIWFFNSPTEHSAKGTNFTLPSVDTPSLAISVDNFVAASTASVVGVAGVAGVAGVESIEQQSSAVFESLASSSAAVEAQASSTPAVVAATSVSATTALVAVNNKSSKKSVSAASVTAVAKSSVASATASASAIAPPDLAIKKTGLDEISFTFRGECWLEVSDSRGDVLATELQAAKSKLNLVGKAPFDVKLGNANAVSIQLNGKKIAVTPVSGTKVLTLKVSDN